MAARKLQTEIDRVIKKVAEGVELFEETYESLREASNSTQKDKLEQELKKEIKKLQRYRDQIKTWIASNEIKDKRVLLENRKLIETQMEKFKACERELKTKPFSKEGMAAAGRVDPLEKEKEDLIHWINDTNEKLVTQIDKFEAEQEVLQAAVKKQRKSDSSKVERLEQLNEHIDSHKHHITKLEIVLRLLENGNLTVEQVKNIKDSVDYYVDSNQDPGFIEDDSIYDELNLEEAEVYGLVADEDKDSSHESFTDNTPSTPPKEQPPSNATSRASGAGSTAAQNDAPHITSPSKSTAAAAAPAPAAATGKQPGLPAGFHKAEPKTPKGKKGAASAQTPSSASSRQHGPPSPTALDGQSSSSSVAPVPPPPGRYASTTSPTADHDGPHTPSTRKTGQVAREAANAALASVPLSGTSASLSAAAVVAGGGKGKRGKDANISVTTSSASAAANQASDAKNAAISALANPPTSAAKIVAGAGSSAATGAGSAQTGRGKGKNAAAAAGAAGGKATSASAASASSQSQQRGGASAAETPRTPQQATTSGNVGAGGAPPTPSGAASNAVNAAAQQGAQEAIDNRLPASLGDLVASFEATKERSIKNASGDLSFLRHMLESSFRSVPDQLDSERPKYYQAAQPCSTPPYYPQQPLAVFDATNPNAAIYEKLDIDTLFFLFYYQTETGMQARRYLAARELKRQSWRFHKKYLTWFQRHEEPKVIEDEYEQGTYIYFDYEGAWCQRKKTEFRFDYKHLEDAELA